MRVKNKNRRVSLLNFEICFASCFLFIIIFCSIKFVFIASWALQKAMDKKLKTLFLIE